MHPAKRARLDEAGRHTSAHGNTHADAEPAAGSTAPLLPAAAAGSAAPFALQSANAEEAAALQLIRQHPQWRHILLEGMQQHVQALRLAQLRSRVLVPDVLALALAFLPVNGRLRCGSVSRIWRRAVQHPSLWRAVGWSADADNERSASVPPPRWLRFRLPYVRCGIDWLLSARALRSLQNFRQLRHLELDDDLHRSKSQLRVSVDTLRSALAALPLESFALPPYYRRGRLYSVLVAALTQPSLQGQPPLLVTWSSSLTQLQCDANLADASALLPTAARCVWPRLEKLQLFLLCNPFKRPSTVESEAMATHVQRWLSPQSTPALTSLKYAECCLIGGCLCAALHEQPLSYTRSLTELCLCWNGRRSVMDFLRCVSADSMPRLRSLTIDGRLTALAAGDEEAEATALLQRMPLTALRLRRYAEGCPWLSHLPQLRELRCGSIDSEMPSIAPLVVAITSAPGLEKLVLLEGVPADELLFLAHHWIRRVYPPDDFSSDRTSAADTAAAAPPLLRELHFEPDRVELTTSLPLHRNFLARLGHLPHLRVLRCAVDLRDLRVLCLLRHLEELHLRPLCSPDRPGGPRATTWSNSSLRALGDLALPRLHTLRLRDAESDDAPSDDHGDEGEASSGPGDEEGNGTRRPAAASDNVTVDGGLLVLLELPALTSLGLPLIKPHTLREFFRVLRRKGQGTLRVEVASSDESATPRREWQWLDTAGLLAQSE